MSQTFAMVKPDCFAKRKKIINLISKNGFRIAAQMEHTFTKRQARNFYAVHKDRPFFNDLVEYMTSGPVLLLVLVKENAVSDFRDLLGKTNPAEAADGTIRKMFGKSLDQNGSHGSDSDENAKIESRFFFPKFRMLAAS